MISNHIELILYITGAVTASMIVQFLIPGQFLKIFNKIELSDPAGLFFARHWGFLAATFGTLLIYAGSHAEIRTPILIAAGAEKITFVLLILLNARSFAKGLLLAAAFDSLCVILYLLYLAGV